MTATTTREETLTVSLRVVGHEFLGPGAAADHSATCQALGLRVWSNGDVVAVIVDCDEDEDLVRVLADASGGVTAGH